MAYLRLLAHRGVPRLLAAALLTRLGTPVLSLALLLVAVQRLGSYAVAGLALTAHALALASLAPVGGRLADRHRPQRVLAGFLVVHVLAYGLVLAVLTARLPAPWLVAAAALLGASTPPAAAVTRGCWPRMVPADALHTAYALDNISNELMFIVGPVLVSVLLVVMPAQLVLMTTGVAVLAGTLLLISVRTVPESPSSRAPRAGGALRDRVILALLIIAACDTFAFGCLRIATAAAATAFGAVDATGLLAGLLSAGALAGGLAYGARTWRIGGRRLLIMLCLADGVALLGAAFAPGLAVLALLVTVTGLLTGPREAVQQVLIAEHAAAGRRTEVFGWLNTFMWAGYGLGTAVSGRLTGPAGNGALALGAAALVTLLGAALVAALYRPGVRAASPYGLPTTP